MTAIKLAGISKEKCAFKLDFAEEDDVPVTSLALLTGFPEDFIRKELVLEKDFVPMKDLRKAMITFLKSTMGDKIK